MLCGLALLAALAGGPQVTSISLERTPCFGTCPVYWVSLAPDGTIQYCGKRFVKRIGLFRAHIPAATYRSFAKTLRLKGFWSLKDSYSVPVTDQASALTRVSSGSESKRINDYGSSGPQWLTDFDAEIDKAIEKATGWTGMP